MGEHENHMIMPALLTTKTRINGIDVYLSALVIGISSRRAGRVGTVHAALLPTVS